MALRIRKLGKHLAAEVTGVDLRQPLADAEFSGIEDAFHEHAVLVFPGQAVDDDQQIAFSRRFGDLETSIRHGKFGGSRRPEISYLANVDENGDLYAEDDPRFVYHEGNQWWHSDSSFKPVPANASILSGRTVPPEGGETEFADLRAAWDSLEDGLQERLEGEVAEHSIVHSRMRISGDVFTEDEKEKLPAVRQALVRTHPATGRKAVYVGSHTSRIVGWDEDEGRGMLDGLVARATRPEFVYSHRWRTDDLVMWDNRCVMHRGRPWDARRFPRVMIRTTVAGDGPTV